MMEKIREKVSKTSEDGIYSHFHYIEIDLTMNKSRDSSLRMTRCEESLNHRLLEFQFFKSHPKDDDLYEPSFEVVTADELLFRSQLLPSHGNPDSRCISKVASIDDDDAIAVSKTTLFSLELSNAERSLGWWFSKECGSEVENVVPSPSSEGLLFAGSSVQEVMNPPKLDVVSEYLENPSRLCSFWSQQSGQSGYGQFESRHSGSFSGYSHEIRLRKDVKVTITDEVFTSAPYSGAIRYCKSSWKALLKVIFKRASKILGDNGKKTQNKPILDIKQSSVLGDECSRKQRDGATESSEMQYEFRCAWFTKGSRVRALRRAWERRQLIASECRRESDWNMRWTHRAEKNPSCVPEPHSRNRRPHSAQKDDRGLHVPRHDSVHNSVQAAIRHCKQSQQTDRSM